MIRAPFNQIYHNLRLVPRDAVKMLPWGYKEYLKSYCDKEPLTKGVAKEITLNTI